MTSAPLSTERWSAPANYIFNLERKISFERVMFRTRSLSRSFRKHKFITNAKLKNFITVKTILFHLSFGETTKVGEAAWRNNVWTIRRLEGGKRSGCAGWGCGETFEIKWHRLSQMQIQIRSRPWWLHALHLHTVQIWVLLWMQQRLSHGSQVQGVTLLCKARSSCSPSSKLFVLSSW